MREERFVLVARCMGMFSARVVHFYESSGTSVGAVKWELGYAYMCH